MADDHAPAPTGQADGFWDLAALSDLSDGSMLAVRAGEEKILLTRWGGEVVAVGGTCPHAGGDLAEGVRCGHVVICPWHKASFDLRSGARVEPPAVDPLPRYPVRIEGGRILVSMKAAAAETTTGVDDRCFVILGAGAAGQSAAQALREEGFAGRLVMISREPDLPYDRTVLSKYRLSGKSGAEKSPLQDASFYEGHRIQRMTAEVTEVDTVGATIRFADGGSLTYDAVLIATGGTPKAPALSGAELRNVFLLRSGADTDAILAAAEKARRAVIIGGGFIGMEAAASLRERGLAVTVIMPESTPFEHPLGPKIGGIVARLHESKGVVLRTSATVAAIEGHGAVSAVRLASGDCIPADLVIIGGGIRPATDILRDVSLREDGGVYVDKHLRASDRLFAAGDLAVFPLRGDGGPLRVEHWRVAQQQGRVAALNMLGHETPFEAVPYFWTIHFLKRLDYVGHAETWDDIVVDGDLEKPEFIALYVKTGWVQAVIGWDRDQDIARTICLFERRREWQADDFLAALAEERAKPTA